MPAEVETMMYVREKPWHGLGRRVEEAPTAQDAIRLAGLDWQVEREAIYNSEGKLITGYSMNVRSSDKKILGVVGNRYSIIQNKEAFDFTNALIQNDQIVYETAGSLRGGRQIWLLARMPDVQLAGDKTEPYICFTNTHDGSGAVRCCMTPVRVVCNNTLNIALNGAARSWSATHRGRIKLKLEDARRTLRLADDYLVKLEEKADELANSKMSEGEMRETLDILIPEDAGDTPRRRENVQAMRDQIMICTLSPDLVKFANTKWQFINALADYVGHADPLRKTERWKENRWSSILNGLSLMDRALRVMQ